MNDNYWFKQAINERLFGLDKEEAIKGTVTLTGGQEVKVNLDYLTEFLQDNKKVIQTKRINRRGSVRKQTL